MPGFLRLGALVDAAHARTADDVSIPTSELTTHGVIVGMTGSGKTGLGIVMIEEALRSGVPCLLFDPKGDLGNLALTFPALTGAELRPWIDDAEATRQGTTPDAFAEQQATAWRDGLASWGLGPDELASFTSGVDVRIYTPGSTSGIPLNVIGSLAAPKVNDPELLADEVEGFVSGLLGLVGITADPLSSKEHVLLSNLVAAAWNEGRDLDLPTLVAQVATPPIRKLGVFDLDTFYPPAERTKLAITLNGLLASPSFAAWGRGDPVDLDELLGTTTGRPTAAVISLAHLSDPERHFVVSLVLGKLITWMRRQSGTSDLRALCYLDEVAGYLPPVGEPPPKRPLLTLFKQARAFGVGMVVATQNPVDVDYKALSNAGTWMIGRLTTQQDIGRLVDGLRSAAGSSDPTALSTAIAGLAKREFLLRRAGREGTVTFTTRWTLSYLRGPLTREQLATLTAQATALPPPPPGSALAPPPAGLAPSAAPPVAPPVGAGAGSPMMPRVAPDVPVRHVAPDAGWITAVGGVSGSAVHAPAVLVRASLLFDDTASDVRHDDEVELVWVPVSELVDAEAFVPVAIDDATLMVEVPAGATYLEVRAPIATKSWWTSMRKQVVDHVVRTRTIPLHRNRELKMWSTIGETREAFAARCTEAAREQAIAAAQKVHDSAQAKIEAQQARVQAAEHKAEVARSQASTKVTDEVIGGAGDLLGALFGGGKRSAISSSAKRTADRRGAAATAAKRVDAAEDAALAAQAKLSGIESELQGKLDDINALWSAKATAIEDATISVKKTNVTVSAVVLAWIPWDPGA